MAFLTEPCFRRRFLAFLLLISNSSMIILVPRSTSFLFVNCISTILFPRICPIFIMVVVVIILSINFWAVPDFIRVLPVTNSGPTIATIGISASFSRFEPGLHVIQAVSNPFCLASFTPPITYGVPGSSYPDNSVLTVNLIFLKIFPCLVIIIFC